MDSNTELDSNDSLAIVVPVSLEPGSMNNLKSWLSIIPQGPIRVFVIHDQGDNDSTIELSQIIESCADERIQLTEVQVRAPGLARNIGLAMVTQEWVAFVDSDDIPDVRSIIKMIKERNFDSKVLVGQYETYDYSSKKKILNARKSSFLDLALNVGIWRIVFNSTVIEKKLFTNLRMGEDQIFLLTLQIFKQKVQFQKIKTYKYFKNVSNQLTQNTNAIQDISKAIPITLDYLNHSSGKETGYILIMLLRQVITEFKYCTTKRFFVKIMTVFHWLRRIRPRYKIFILSSFFKIILYRIINA
jgi:glycosyltransferase involved in cell wall biosynthesis